MLSGCLDVGCLVSAVLPGVYFLLMSLCHPKGGGGMSAVIASQESRWRDACQHSGCLDVSCLVSGVLSGVTFLLMSICHLKGGSYVLAFNTDHES